MRKHFKRIICWYCERPIKGKAHNWGGHIVHKGCRDKCCAKLRKIRPGKSSPPRRDNRGLLARIFNL